jgi:hypothetical protein
MFYIFVYFFIINAFDDKRMGYFVVFCKQFFIENCVKYGKKALIGFILNVNQIITQQLLNQ